MGLKAWDRRAGKISQCSLLSGYRISCFCQHSAPWGVVPHPGTCQLQDPWCHSRLAVQPWSMKMCPGKTLSSAPRGSRGLCWGAQWLLHVLGHHTQAELSCSFRAGTSLMAQERGYNCSQSQGSPSSITPEGQGWNGLADLQDLFLFCPLTCTQQPPAVVDPDMARLLMGPVNVWIWGCQDKHLERLWISAVPRVGDTIPKPLGSQPHEEKGSGNVQPLPGRQKL